MPKALITGITGQDGYYLARFLGRKGYDIVGVVRPERLHGPSLAAIAPLAKIVPGDLKHPRTLREVIEKAEPDEIYHLAGITTLDEAAHDPAVTRVVNADAPLAILDAVAEHGSYIRFCQASSSQIFGPADGLSRDEDSPLNPHNEYASAKAVVTQEVRRRRGEGVFACSAILFNHESPRRRPEFVSRKISLGVARIAAGTQRHLKLGSLDAARDWSFAGDCVEAMWMMLQADRADDYVLASGSCRTVREMVSRAFSVVGISDWETYVISTSSDGDQACSPGDAGRARERLGWSPRVSFGELVTMMVEHDVQATEDDPTSGDRRGR